MAMKFRKSIKVAPGVKVTLGRRSASVSVGPRGLKHSVNTRGEVHRTTSIPGTGLYDRQRIGTIGGNNHTVEQTPTTPENNPLIITDEQLADMSPGKKKMYRITCYVGIVICVLASLLFFATDINLLGVIFLLIGLLFIPMSRRYKNAPNNNM